jgi:hypothetical protein
MTKRPKASEGQDGSTAEEPVRPRTFEEVVAANLKDPFHAARIARLSMGERFDDATANSTEAGRAHGERHQLGDIFVRGTWEKFILFGALTLGLVLLAWGVLIELGIL